MSAVTQSRPNIHQLPDIAILQSTPVSVSMETFPSRHLTLSPPFPFAIKREEEDKMIFGDKSNFREIKPEFSERKSGFRFEHLATEFENKMDTENDSGIGKHSTSP